MPIYTKINAEQIKREALTKRLVITFTIYKPRILTAGDPLKFLYAYTVKKDKDNGGKITLYTAHSKRPEDQVLQESNLYGQEFTLSKSARIEAGEKFDAWRRQSRLVEEEGYGPKI